MTYAVGDRVKFTGLDIPRREAMGAGTGGAFDLIREGYYGTVDEVVPDDTSKLFIIFDEVACPLADMSRLLGMSTGWPILDSEVEPLATAEAA